MYPTLRDFVNALDRAGELKRISARVSPILEIAEISDRMSKLRAPSVGATGKAADPLMADRGGYALLFENVEGVESEIPVAINLFGSYARMEMALGCHDDGGHTPGGFDAIGAKIASLTRPEPPRGFREAIAKVREFFPLLRIAPRCVRTGICQEVVKTGDDVNLFEIPLIKCWPMDGDPRAVGWPVPKDQPDTSAGQGRFITLAGMYTIHARDRDQPKPASRNIGMYRSQLIDRKRLIMHWHMHHDGAAHWRSWKRLGEKMPIAIVFGGESVLPYAATAPLPPGISELLMAGFLNRGSIKLVRGKTVPLDVPANAEIVIEGYVSTECGHPDFDPWNDETLGKGAVLEGPFGDHTGFYSLPDRYPLLEVTAITHRRDPIYPTTIVGLPPQEDYYLGKATERIFFPLLKTLIHDIEDYDLPLFGCFHNCAVVKMRKEYPLQARRVMHAVWGAGQMAWTKIIIVVDEDVEVHHIDRVLEAMFANCHFARDIELVNGPLDILDHAAPHHGAGHKIGIDATRKMPGEEVNAIAIDESPSPSEGEGRGGGGSSGLECALPQRLQSIERLRDFHLPKFANGRALFVQIEKDEGRSARPIIESTLRTVAQNADQSVERASRPFERSDLDLPDFIIAVDPDVDVTDRDAVLFRWGSHCDPGRDLIRIDDHPHAVAFDCTSKSPAESQPGRNPIRRFPPILRMNDGIRQRVTERWSRDYGFEIG